MRSDAADRQHRANWLAAAGAIRKVEPDQPCRGRANAPGHRDSPDYLSGARFANEAKPLQIGDAGRDRHDRAARNRPVDIVDPQTLHHQSDRPFAFGVEQIHLQTLERQLWSSMPSTVKAMLDFSANSGARGS